MATAIVPSTTTRPADLIAAHELTYAEVHALALFLCEEEGLTLAQAMQAAADDLGCCLAYAQQWDDLAFLGGNTDAGPF